MTFLIALPETHTNIAILLKFQVNSAESGVFAIAAAMSGFVRFGHGKAARTLAQTS
jgi:hypothetical protein